MKTTALHYTDFRYEPGDTDPTVPFLALDLQIGYRCKSAVEFGRTVYFVEIVEVDWDQAIIWFGSRGYAVRPTDDCASGLWTACVEHFKAVIEREKGVREEVEAACVKAWQGECEGLAEDLA